MLIAFTDESGIPSPKDLKRYFVVAVLVTPSARRIELHIRRARRSLRRRHRASELKASQSHPRVIRRVLQAIAEEPCEIYAVIVDKQGLVEKQAEIVYRKAVARAIAYAVKRHPRLHIYIDKRYTNPHQQLELEYTIREAIAPILDQLVLIEQIESTRLPGLQAVDFIAWALAQKYEFSVNEWFSIIAQRCVVVEVVKATKISGSAWGPITTA